MINSVVVYESHTNFTAFLGKVLDSVALISFSSRILQINKRINISDAYYSDLFLETTALIPDLISEMDKNIEIWNGCSSLSFLKEKKMPVVFYHTQPHNELTNLDDFLIDLQSNVIEK